ATSIRVILDGDLITDHRGYKLDGDGDGQPGGMYQQTEIFGEYTLADEVPAYLWYFGCSPTAASMLAGYYDGQASYEDLIPGDASTQTDAVFETIASSGDGEYAIGSDGSTMVTLTPGTPGTGHIPDYAFFDGVDDSQLGTEVEPDLSEQAVRESWGVQPHADDSMADFLETSWSVHGLNMGWTATSNIAPGIEEFFEAQGYTAEAQQYIMDPWLPSESVLNWEMYKDEIDAGRPMLLGVDSDGDGISDHSVVGIGYDTDTGEYAMYDTWTEDVRWESWEPTQWGTPWGISTGTTLSVS
ncbi:MAG: hypothetical protein ACOC93_01970, partial [Planctomycetota bacterium]